jgi:hypothetical protein
MGNLREFLEALIAEWWPLMSCAAFTLLSLGIAFVKRDSTKWFVRGSILLAVFFFGVASFLAWNNEHKARLLAEGKFKEDVPKLSVEVGAIGHAFLVEQRNTSVITLWITITNHGSPSTFSMSRVFVDRSNGERVEEKIRTFIPETITLDGTPGTPNVILRKDDAIPFLQNGKPIEKGGAIKGWMMFFVPNIPAKELDNGKDSVILEGYDVDGKPFSVKSIITQSIDK